MTPGPLILAGGAEFDDRMAPADRAWFAAKAASRPRVAVLPTANQNRPDLAAANGSAHFRSLGAEAEPLMVTTRWFANDEATLSRLDGLDFAYFAGGNPRYLAETLAGSKLWLTLAEMWRQGMGLGGSSAGAMVMCEAIFVQGLWQAGLGLIPGAVVLPHFNNRDEDSITRVRQAVTERGYMGIGIDESTALIWTPDEGWRVVGPGKAWILTAEGVTQYGDGSAPDGLPEPAR
jgi:cyanophycinase